MFRRQPIPEEGVGAADDLTLVTIPGASHFVQQDAAELVSSTMKSWLAARAR